MNPQFKAQKEGIVNAVSRIDPSMMNSGDRNVIAALSAIPDSLDGVRSVESLLGWSSTLGNSAQMLYKAGQPISTVLNAQSLAISVASNAYRINQTPATACHVARRINEYVRMLNETNNTTAALHYTNTVIPFIQSVLSSAVMERSDADASLGLRYEMGNAQVQRAIAMEASGNIDAALQCAHQAVEAYRALSASSSWQTPDFFREYAMALRLAGRLAERVEQFNHALEYYQEALVSNIKAHGANHDEVRESQANVTRVQRAIEHSKRNATGLTNVYPSNARRSVRIAR